MTEHDNSSRALAALRGLLVRLDNPEGRLPPERALAAEFGVGRGALRRALEVLEAEGLIWRQQGKGTYVGLRPADSAQLLSSLVDRTNPVEVFEARLQLEPALAGLAAMRATHQDVRRLRDLSDRVAKAVDHDSRELWDGALHRLVAQAAGNSLLFGVYEIVEEVRRDDAWRSLRERARSDTSLAAYAGQHATIVDAIARRDPGAAEHAMRDHIACLARNILAFHAPEVSLVG